jgi:hypothetical protein
LARRRILLQAAGGLGLVALVALVGFSSGAAAQQLTTLYSFNGDDGASPYADLIADRRAISTARLMAAAPAGKARCFS